MQLRIFQSLLFLVLWLCLSFVRAADIVYVIDKLDIGLHADQSVESPISKLVPSGTELDVIEQVGDLIKVQEPGGIQGWINIKYTVKDKPGRAQVTALENENKKLQKEIELLKSKSAALENTISPNATIAQKELEQQLNSERLKVGEMQAQLTDLKTRIADVNNSELLLEDIKRLEQENKQLVAQLASSGIAMDPNISETNKKIVAVENWKTITITLIIALIIGMVVGALILDYFSRRRHGGFRV